MSSKRSRNKMSWVSRIALFSSLACAAAAQDPGAAVTLAYQFPEGKTISYRHASTEKQYMQISGQDVNTQTQSSMEFSARQKSMKEGAFGLGVTVDAMKISVQGPQGETSPDLSQIPGKSFDMTLSRLGREIDTSGAGAITYQIGASSSRDLSPSFQTFFPDLPDRPVKQGDTWPSQDSVTQKLGNGELLITSKNANKLDGFETVDGFECARIKTEITGTVKGNLQEGGVGLTVDGSVVGTAIWYFAIKQGLLVKADTKGGFSGTITAGEPANATIPLSGETQEEVRLVKK